MLLEEYIDKGIILTQLLAAAKRTPITLDNGQVIINGKSFGAEGGEIAIDLMLAAIEEAFSKEEK